MDRHGLFAGDDPFALARAWLSEAEASEPNDPNAIALATVDADGLPNVRMVLLKDVEVDGGGEGAFVFYTNYGSKKAQEIDATGKAAFVMHWKSLRRQIRIEGTLKQVGDGQADAYFASRSRASQLGAVASEQSRPMTDRAEFVQRYEAAEARFAGGPVERPAHWTGFRLCPEAMEFWLDRPGRLHDRRRFVRDGPGGGWTDTLLYP